MFKKLEAFEDHLTRIDYLWDEVTGGPGVGTDTVGRTGRYGVFGNGDCSLTEYVDAYGTYIIGGAFQINVDGGSWALSKIFEFLDGSTSQIYVRINADLSMSVLRGDGTLLASSASDQLLTRSASWLYYIEFKAKIHNTTGNFTLKVNGVTWCSDSNVDTQNSATAQVTRVKIAVVGSHVVTCGWDDVYIADDQGGVNDDFQGPIRLYTLRPNGIGDRSEFTPLSGDNYTNVDETSSDDDTSYVTGAIEFSGDSYEIESLASSGVVKGVQLTARMVKAELDVKQVDLMLTINGSEYHGNTKTLTVDYAYYQDVWDENPDTSSSWGNSDFTDLQIGLEIQV